MKLKHVLFALFGLITLGPLAVLWAWLASCLMEQEMADVKDRHLLFARNLAANLQHYHRDISSAFELMAENLAAGKSVAKADDIVQNLHFRHICLADAKTGAVRRQISPAGALCPAKVPAERFAMFKSLAEAKRLSFSEVMAGPDGKPLIYVVKPIGGWLAVGAVQTDYFVSLGKSVSFGIKGHAAIVDHAGNVLAHPMPDWVAARRNIAKVAAVAQMLKGKSGVGTFYSPAIKGDMIAGFAPVSGPGWGVMVPQPLAELRASANVARDSILIVVAAGLLGAALLAALVTRPLARPLNRLIEATGEIEKGNSAARVDVIDSWYVPRELKDAQRR
ncbi:MAG: cache domain-containing protein, partial [Methyloligellaceae bacterium]